MSNETCHSTSNIQHFFLSSFPQHQSVPIVNLQSIYINIYGTVKLDPITCSKFAQYISQTQQCECSETLLFLRQLQYVFWHQTTSTYSQLQIPFKYPKIQLFKDIHVCTRLFPTLTYSFFNINFILTAHGQSLLCNDQGA